MLHEGWQAYYETCFPDHVGAGFAPHHEALHDWFYALQPGAAPDPYPSAFILILARGGGKSTSLELATTLVGAMGSRQYVLYVRETQGAADKSVLNIAALLESPEFARHYPRMASRKVGRHGNSRGWRRNRLWTDSGFVVDAVGLDTASRGLKVEAKRPDLVIFDDIDGKHDTPRTTAKKEATITDSIIPAGAEGAAYVGVQNLIIPDGVFSRLADGRAEYLADRRVSGPHPAIRGLITERRLQEGRVRTVITGGTPTWVGQSVEDCQRRIDNSGFNSFDRECQHNVRQVEGALWARELLNESRRARVPEVLRITVGVDPPASTAEAGIVGAGLGADTHGYVLEDCSRACKPAQWGRLAVLMLNRLTLEHECPGKIVAEKNQGGEMVRSVIESAYEKLKTEGLVTSPFLKKRLVVRLVHAAKGKRSRAEPVHQKYDEGLAHHMGELEKLETQMTTWDAELSTESPDRMDACVWALTDLLVKPIAPRARRDRKIQASFH